MYIKDFYLVPHRQEIDYIWDEVKMTCYPTFYPFKIFMDDRFPHIKFEPLTIFYGGNGSGKSTLLNIIAEKAGVKRNAPFNSTPFFPVYVDMCRMNASDIPDESRIMTSDDVFDYILDVRTINNGTDLHRDDLIAEYYRKADTNVPDNLSCIKDYERWKELHDIRRGKTSASEYVRQNMNSGIDMHSNGENAMNYFVNTIEEKALYLLDEPENSLSVEYQLQLKTFLEDSARYFGCQIIMTTHSPILLSIKGAKIYNLDIFPVEEYKWTELENVRRYFDFFKEHEDEFVGQRTHTP